MMDETIGYQQATQSDIGWLAGIIDGEGHLGLSYQHKRRCTTIKFDMQIVNCDDALIEKVVRIMRLMGVNPLLRDRIHVKKTWNRNTIVTVGKMAHIERILKQTVHHMTGVKYEKAILMLALIEMRINKRRAPYDAHENAIVQKFRDIYIGNCGASTTAREELAKAKLRYRLISHENARGESEEDPPPA